MRMLGAVLAVCVLSALNAEELQDLPAKDLTLKIPAAWKKEESKSPMRAAQARIPALEGDKEDAELVVFTFPGGGSIEANIQRWVGQFKPEDRTASLVKGKCAHGAYWLLDVVGTYKKTVGAPMSGKTEDAPGMRMLAIILPLEGKGQYFLKLTGPDKTAAAQKDALRASVGGDKATEEEAKL